MTMLRRSLLAAVLTLTLGFAAPVAAASPAPATAHGQQPAVELLDSRWGGDRDQADLREAVGAVDDDDAGRGVGIALIDSGVTASFAASHENVVVGPDLTGGGDPRDGYGHGTFLASLIVGGSGSSEPVRGIAPGATLVSVKAARDDGTTDVQTLMDAVRWTVDNRAAHNIRVLVLAVGVDPLGPYTDSPLAAVLEVAWASGIVVVVPSGNDGTAGVSHPADDPWLLSVGASDSHGTSTPDDDTVAPWSGRSSSPARPDVVAPGTSVLGARAPGTTVDRENPSARKGHGLFVGSGTSMSAAVVGGGAAVVVQHHPNATPDDVKGAIRDSARPIDGAGQLDIEEAIETEASATWVQDHEIALDELGGQLPQMPWAGVSWTGVS